MRDQRVILDNDLATVYGVPTKRQNEQYRRNASRFPADFACQHTQDEWAALTSHVATVEARADLRSQNATSKPHGGALLRCRCCGCKGST
ncbi:MAG: ORF6N domain-containing protein [Verrucomicrobiota bacterium]